MSRSTLFRLLVAVALLAGTTLAGFGQDKPRQPEGEREKAIPRKAEQAQKATPPEKEASKEQEESKERRLVDIRSGTKIMAELESTLDTRTAQPGEEVVARVTKNVKQKGETVIHKGDRLLGRVTAVEAEGEAESGSRLAVVFDRLVQGEAVSELHTAIRTVLSTPSEERARREEMLQEPPQMAPPPSSAPRSGSTGSAGASGGVLGGMSSTAGSVVGSATGAVASTADATLQGAGSTVDATTRGTLGSTTEAVVATPARAIRVHSQSEAEHQTGLGSVLSTREGHLRLESGTRLRFEVLAESQAQDEQPPSEEKK
ncbi:MAG: hypothetical protein HYY26_00725 [Acidobacteria bacterium]|nr:hypothetical protein [Acidobacteriota bacterium]